MGKKTPTTWVPSLYYFQGLPYALVLVLSSILYKEFQINNAKIALYTSLLLLPWSLKPLFSPLLEVLSTKRKLTIVMESVLVLLFFGMAASLFSKNFFLLSLLILTLIALVSSMHDIVSDGLYLVNLSNRQQTLFVGIRTLFYQLARLSCQGGLVVLAGFLAMRFSLQFAWQMVFVVLACLSFILVIYHWLVLPESENIQIGQLNIDNLRSAFVDVIRDFFALPGLIGIVVFLLFYNFAEIQLLKIVPLFLLDKTSVGGLGFSVEQVGVLFGVVAVPGMMLGAVLGGWLIAKFSMKKALLPLTIFTVIANGSYLLVSYYQLQNFWLIAIAMVVVQFAFGLANSAYMSYLLMAVSKGRYKMSSYAIGTAVMALGMVFAGSVSGTIQTWLGYNGFFVWIIVAGFFIIFLAKKAL